MTRLASGSGGDAESVLATIATSVNTDYEDRIINLYLPDIKLTQKKRILIMRNLHQTSHRFYPELIFSVITIVAVAVMCLLIQHEILRVKVYPIKPVVTVQIKPALKKVTPENLLAQPGDTKTVGVRMSAAD